MRRSTLVIGVFALVAGCVVTVFAQTESRSLSPVVGAWRIMEVTQSTGANPPQTGFVLFTATHYSIVRSDTDRPDFKDQSKVTPEEALVVWGALQTQSGTYEISGNKLTTHILVSKNPQGMRSRASNNWTFKLDSDGLVLTEVGSQNPRTFRLVRAE
jgi:hypothetical protein